MAKAGGFLAATSMSWISDRVDYFLSPWRDLLDVRADVVRHELALQTLRSDMTSNEDAAYARAGEVVGLIKAEFASLRGQIDAAVQDKDAAVAAGVESALNEDSAADTERLSGLISELESVLPAQVPDVPVPAPGEAAEVPSDPAPVEPVADPAQPVETQPDDAA